MEINTQIIEKDQVEEMLLKEANFIYQLQESFRTGDFDTFNRLHQALRELRKKIYAAQINFPDTPNPSNTV